MKQRLIFFSEGSDGKINEKNYPITSLLVAIPKLKTATLAVEHNAAKGLATNAFDQVLFDLSLL